MQTLWHQKTTTSTVVQRSGLLLFFLCQAGLDSPPTSPETSGSLDPVENPVLVSRAAPNSLNVRVSRATAGPAALDQDFEYVHKTHVHVLTLAEARILIYSLQLGLDKFPTVRDWS